MHSTLKKSAFPILLLLSLFSMQLILHPNSSAFDSSAKSSYGDKVKAVFLHHFLRYITWPDRDQSGPYEIIFIGDSSIIPIIESIAKKKKISNRTVQIRIIQSTGELDLETCHILFIGQSKKNELPKLLKESINHHVLTVSDQPGYALQGVAINFIKKEGRIRFEINLDTMKAAEITPSSQILKLAHLVKNG